MSFRGGGCPVISVDEKKKELVGNYKNAGQEWSKKGESLEVEAYDFVNAELGKVTPYGVYDLAHNAGWVSVGIDSDTAEFAVSSIKRWWEEMGEWVYPPMQKRFLFMLTEAEAMAAEIGHGKRICKNGRIRKDLLLRFVTFRQAPVNGIKLSTECFAILQETGADALW